MEGIFIESSDLQLLQNWIDTVPTKYGWELKNFIIQLTQKEEQRKIAEIVKNEEAKEIVPNETK